MTLRADHTKGFSLHVLATGIWFGRYSHREVRADKHPANWDTLPL